MLGSYSDIRKHGGNPIALAESSATMWWWVGEAGGGGSGPRTHTATKSLMSLYDK